MIRRLIAAVVALSLVVLSPGLPCYQAMAATLSSDAAPSVAPRSGAAGLSSIQAIPSLPQALPLTGVSAPQTSDASDLSAPAAVVSAEAAADVSAPSDVAAFAPAPSRVARAGAMQRVAGEISSFFSLRKAAMAAALGLAVAAGPTAASSHPLIRPAATLQLAAAPAAAPVADETPAQVNLPVTLSAKAAAAAQTAAIGDSISVTLTLKNDGQAEQKIADLRAVLEKAAPAAIAIKAVSVNALTLAPGQEATIQVQVQILQIPVGDSPKVQVPAFRVEAPGGVSFNMPALEATFKPVLPMPNWKDGDFNPPKQPLVQQGWQMGWLIGLPFLGLIALLYRRARGLAAPATAPAAGPSPARQAALAALEQLGRLAAEGSDKAFYGGFGMTLGRLITDRLGLRADNALTFKQIAAIAAGSGRFDAAQLQALEAALARADRVVFGGASADAATMARDLALARGVVDLLAPAPASASSGAVAAGVGTLALLPALDGLHWGNEYALALLLGLVFVGWRVVKNARSEDGAVTVASTAKLASPGFFSGLKRWVIGAVFAGALTAGALSSAQPMFSAVRQTLMVPVTMILDVLDRSGSMGSPMTGTSISKLDAAKAGEEMFLDDQAKGATNQIGEIIFDTKVSVVVPMTSDLKVDKAGLKQITVGGGTDIELAIKITVNQFLKRNIVLIDEVKHPEAAELKRIMRTKGLTAALHYAQSLPEGSPVWNLVVRPDQAKVIRFATDGDSPGDLLGAARIAKMYGIKIYTIGLPASDLKEDVLQQIAGITGGTYARADDPQALAKVYMAISKEIKTPQPTQQVTEKNYAPGLAALAFWLTVLGLALSHVPLMRRPSLKVLSVAATLLVYAAPASIALLSPAPASAQTQTLPAQPSLTPQPKALQPFSSIPELQEGRRLYAQGQPLDAMKSFLKALEEHPEMPEIYADIGTSFLALGDVERAERFLRKGLEMAQKQGKDDLRGWIYYQLGWSALIDGDLEGADLMLRQALRAAPNDLELKQNAERVQRMMQDQQKQDKDQDSKDKKKQKQKQQQKKQQQQKSKGQQDRAQQRRDGQKQDGQPQKGQGQPGEPQEGQDQQPGDQAGNQQGASKKPGDILKELEKAQEQNGGTPTPDPGTFGKMWSVALPLALGAGAANFFPGLSSTAHAAEAAASTVAYGWGDPTMLLWTAAAVVALPVLMAFRAWQLHRRAKAQAPGLAPESLGQSPMARRAFLKGALGVTAAALMGAAAADPWIGTKEVATNFGGGHDIVILPDVSNSVVHAEDGRFDRMVASLDGLIGGLEKSNHLDRLAIVPMADKAGNGMLSAAYDSAREQLYDLREQNFAFQGGTNVAAGIRKALVVFETAPDLGDRDRVILIPTDGGDVLPSPTGDDEAKDLYKAIQEAVAKGVRVYTIGIGSAGAKMIIPDEVRAKDPKLPKYIQDQSGKDVIVRMNPAALEKIAYLGNGKPFMAEAGKGMDVVLKEIAAAERTRSGAKQPTEVVSVRNSVGGAFMIPGVAALIGALALRAKQPLEDAPKNDRATLRSFSWPVMMLWAAPLLPASVGPQLILGFAVSLMLGFWLADRIAGGAYSRRLLNLALVSTGALRRLVARDAAGVFLSADDREIDAKRLTGFLDQWAQAGRGFQRAAARERQRSLLALVNEKDDLWREKLLAAYLYEDSSDMRREIAGALSSIDQRSLHPLRDTLRGILAKTQTVGWLSADPISQRLAALFKREDLADPAVRAYIERLAESSSKPAREAAYRVLESAPAKTRRTWKERLRALPVAAGIGALLLGSVAWNGAGVQNVIKMDAQREAVRASVSQDFFGGDAYLLTQQYTDKRIENDVLPLLRRWETLTSADTPAVEQAIDTLLSSTDNKANQLLMFLYRQHIIFQLNGKIQQKLIRALVERDDPEMLAALSADLEKNPKNQAAQQRMAFAISVMGELKNKHSFASLIQLIGSENDGVRQMAVRTVLKVIRDPKNTSQSLDMLKMSLDNYGKDPEIRLIHVPLLLEALAAKKDITAEDIQKLQPLLEAAVVMDPSKSPTTADEIAAALMYRQQAIAAIAGQLEQHPALKDAPGFKDILWGLLGQQVAKTLELGESATGNSTRFQILAGRQGLRTIKPTVDSVIVDGRFVVAPNVHYGTTEAYLDHYYGDQIDAAAKLFADQAANRAGADQFDLHQDRTAAYFGNAEKTLQAFGKLAAALGMDKAPADGVDPMEAMVDSTASELITQLNSPFNGSTWNSWVAQKLGLSSLPSKLTHEQIVMLLPLMEKVLASGNLDEQSRVSSNSTALTDLERKALGAAIVALKSSVDPATKKAAGLPVFGAQVVSGLSSSVTGWKEFIAGLGQPDDVPRTYLWSSGYDFAKTYTPAQFDALIARIEKGLADNKFSGEEKARVEKALIALRGLRDEMHRRMGAPVPAPAASTGGKLQSAAIPTLLALFLAGPEPKLALAAMAAALVAMAWSFFALGFHKPLRARARANGSMQAVEEREHLLELDGHQVADSILFGSLRSRFKGLDGMEYAESAPPAPGEAVGRVDHAATARMGTTYYKVFEQERDAPLMLVVDLSGSASTGSQAVSRRRVIEDAAGLMAFAAADGGSQRAMRSVGLMIVTDRVESVIEPMPGKEQARRIFQHLATYQPRHTGTNLKAGIDQYLAQNPPHSILVPISDFVDAGKAGDSLAAAADSGHAVLPIVVEDSLDKSGLVGLGTTKVRDSETGAVRESSGEGADADAARLERVQLARAFDRAGARPLTLSTNGRHLDDLIRQAQQLGS